MHVPTHTISALAITLKRMDDNMRFGALTVEANQTELPQPVLAALHDVSIGIEACLDILRTITEEQNQPIVRES